MPASRPRLPLATLVVAALALVAANATPAAAHQSSVTYVEATLDGRSLHLSVRLAPRDLGEALRGSHDRPIELPAIEPAAAAAAIAYVTAGLTVSDGDTPCPPAASPAPTAAALQDRVDVRFTATCPAAPQRLILDYDLLFASDPLHTATLRVRVPGLEPADTILDADHPRFTWDLREPPPSGAWAFVREGIHHVRTGLDHVSFVLALLLVVVLERQAGGWRIRKLVPGLRATAVVVSAFTIAHSISLIAAALGWVSLPTRLVESAIAASIAWTALQDIVRPDARFRFAVTFGFGLMHGLGFARMLTGLLPPSDVVVPLLCFNLGVELAQLTIVAVALPAAWLLGRAIGADHYRRIALPVMAGVLTLLGTIWLVERAAGVTLLGL